MILSKELQKSFMRANEVLFNYISINLHTGSKEKYVDFGIIVMFTRFEEQKDFDRNVC